MGKERSAADLHPIDDALEMECDNFFRLVRQRRWEEKEGSFGIIAQLWDVRVRGGEDLPAPDVPASVIRQQGGFSLPTQIRWVGAIKDRLKARRDSRYGR